MPEDTPLEPDDVLGVDLGVKNIAVDNTGTTFSNEEKVEHEYGENYTSIVQTCKAKERRMPRDG